VELLGLKVNQVSPGWLEIKVRPEPLVLPVPRARLELQAVSDFRAGPVRQGKPDLLEIPEIPVRPEFPDSPGPPDSKG